MRDAHDEGSSKPQDDPPADPQDDPFASDLRGLLLPLALPMGLVVIGVGSYLIPSHRWGGVAVIALGMFITWLGKMASHHTLTQPIGLLFLLVGVGLLVTNWLVGPLPVLVQISLAAIAASAILAPN